ncbi:uncharacterized protein LOC142349742 isoform X3 [Convolutriloba macropyga]|uniref:uncharacterized protein LOC142349742 isoform X3 n=1 Tax=Convolutriloba macropyga TaxID=536237 RepID=UPI003F51DCB3
MSYFSNTYGSRATSSLSSASVSPHGTSTTSGFGTSTPTSNRGALNLSMTTPGSGHASGTATPGGHQGGVMMGSGDHGSTSGGPTNADESNLLMISPAATGVINLPVQPTTFAPVDIPTSEVSKLKEMIQDQHTQIMKLSVDLEVTRGQKQFSMFHDPNQKTIISAADAELRRLLSEIENLKNIAKTKDAARETELERIKENSQLMEQELRDEIEERDRKMKEFEKAEKERFDNSSKAYDETIFNQEMAIKKLKEDIERAKAKNVSNMEAKDLEIETLKNDHQLQITKMREEVEKQRIDELLSEKNDSVKKFDDMKNKLDNLVADLRSQVNKLSVEKETGEKRSKDQITKLNSEIQTKLKQIKDLESKADLLNKENTKFKSSLLDKKSEHEKATRELENEFQQTMISERNKSRDELEQARELSLKAIKEKDSLILDLKKQLQEMTAMRDLTRDDLSTKLAQTEELLKGQIQRAEKEYQSREKHDQRIIEDLKIKVKKDANDFTDKLDKLTQERDNNKINFEREKVEAIDQNQKQIENLTQKFKAEIDELKSQNVREKDEIVANFKSEEKRLNDKRSELDKDLRNIREQLRKTCEEREQFEKLKQVEFDGLMNNYKLLQEDQQNALKSFDDVTNELKISRDKEMENIKSEFRTEMDLMVKELKETKTKANADILELEQANRNLAENIENLKRETEVFGKKKDQEIKVLTENYDRKIAKNTADFEANSSVKAEEIEKLKSSLQDMESKFKHEIEELNIQRQNLLSEFEKEKNELVASYEQTSFEQTKQFEERIRITKDELNSEISEWKDSSSKRDDNIRNLNQTIEELKMELAKLENNAKKELEYLGLLKDKEISELNNDITTKNAQIDEIEAKHASQLDELQDKHKDEMLELMTEYQRFKTDSESKISALNQQFSFDILGKSNEISDLSAKFDVLHKEQDQLIQEYESKIVLLKDEQEKAEQSLKNQHLMEIKAKDENIESLNVNIEFLHQEQQKEQEKFRQVLLGYKDYFTEMKVEMDKFIQEMSEKHDDEKRKLNESIESLHQEKIKITEEWKTMEKEMTTKHFNEVKSLKDAHFETTKALDEELRATQEALKDMTLQRDMQIDENKNNQVRIKKLEQDYKKLTDDTNKQVDQMTQDLLKLQAEKKAEFEELQKQLTALQDAKNAMELAKDKLFHETKENLETQLRNLKQDLEAKITKQSQDKQDLNLKLEELNQRFTATVEEKDAILSQTRIEMTENYEAKIVKARKDLEAIINDKAKSITEMIEKFEQQRKEFDMSAKNQKSEFQKILAERDQFINRLKDEHSQSVKEFEEHCEMYKTNAEAKVKELNSTKKSCKDTVSQKDGEIERFLMEVTDVREKLSASEATAAMADTRAEEVKNIEGILVTKSDEIAGLNTKVNTLSENEKEHLREIDILNGDVLGLKSKVGACEAEIRDVNYKLQSSEQYAYSLRKDLDEKEKQISDSLQKYQHEKYQNQAKDRKIEELKTQLNARSYTGTGTGSATSRYDTYDSPTASAALSKWSSLKSDVLAKNSGLYSSNSNLTPGSSGYDSTTSSGVLGTGGAYDSSRSLSRASFATSREPSPSTGRYGSSSSALGRTGGTLGSSSALGKYSAGGTGGSSYSSKYK